MDSPEPLSEGEYLELMGELPDAAILKPSHRPRPDPYPDEMDQLFCDEDGTLCTVERPCLCCVVDAEELAALGDD